MSAHNRRRFLAGSALAAASAVPVLAGSASASNTGPTGSARRQLGGTIRTGADVLAAQRWQPFSGTRLGVFANPTAVLADLTHIVDDLVAADIRPVAAFGPEHGFRGTDQAGGSEGDYVDPRTQIPVYDAYQVTVDDLVRMYRKANLDTVVFDIAGVGARFYTYMWTMYLAMHAAAKTGARFVVLDRPNPVGGRADGPQLDPEFASFVGMKPIVQQPGMTHGELAKLFAAKFLPEEPGSPELSALDVIEVEGWRPDQLFADTGLPWVPPSPNMPSPETALSYPGTCLFEGTLLAEGRGTTRPFETIGAPGIDWRYAEALNELDLPGVRFREAYFVPTFGKFAEELCGGVQLHITEPAEFTAIPTAIAMIVTAKRLHPDIFGWRDDNMIDKLFGSARLRSQVDAGADTAEIVGSWQAELDTFRTEREPFLSY
ncbi:uncharacterized protein YbbC (DUF1343 family) [Tamaricihabitans halophyticus]|uniref:Uncharacterized protein YbbC (DUF1343 family) n=1 Tax=Tamaricihabitans halophyticus TaxID=1262583 RepID=A0A4V2SV42_9PSEU|nr:DUF1343 domain-containing protein [Tamaricihabitans halophyticus]TCP56856.1 uncharacterized protein YbbC (DUF1343 family) [Tamaricihabitans halophyticus]